MELEEHLFRRESGRLVSVLTGIFGIHNLALAEDVVQDAFYRALETWKYHGVPRNPSAWLMAVAKRRAVDVLRREGTARELEPELARFVESEWTLVPTIEEAFEAGGIQDAQLRMMFSCIHPGLPEETQLGLILHLLCGFGLDETAAAFLKTPDAMTKRLQRAKQALAESREFFDLSGSDISRRLPAVQRALYLLFNEGYHGASKGSAVRAELCDEALRLVALLLDTPATATPATHALASLMSFHAARVPSRIDDEGNLILLLDQDRTLWDGGLIEQGRRELNLAARGDELTPYHVEAAIASLHADANRAEDTDWKGIVELYDTLLRIEPSPVVALNRAVAIAERDGAQNGLDEIARIADIDRLSTYPFYFMALGEMKFRLGQTSEARVHFAQALDVARNSSEKRLLQDRIARCGLPH